MEELKQKLTTAPILAYPNFELPFVLDCDASQCSIGSVLSQVQEGKERALAYYSTSLSKPELSYCTTRKELLAIIKSVKHFHPYLYGHPVTIRTDHAAIIWTLKSARQKGQVAR